MRSFCFRGNDVWRARERRGKPHGAGAERGASAQILMSVAIGGSSLGWARGTRGA